MFCCVDSPLSDPGKQYDRQTSDDVVSYPGDRRFVKTGGNALAAAPSGTQSASSNSGDVVVAVKVPPGVFSGQSIHVVAPDGSGRMVMATVPQGMGPGSQFMVQFPSTNQANPSQTPAASAAATAEPEPTVDYAGLIAMAPPASASPASPSEPFVTAVPVPASPGVTAIAPVVVSPVAPITAPVPQSMMKVQVPPGTPVGSTMHVQIPGENRIMAVQVPPGVTEFHVAYEPKQQQAPFVPPATTTTPSVTPIPPPNGERRLMVRVPPGTAPGTTLHITIPDEPGRVIAAQVPAGNVSEFCVSYQPRNHGDVARGIPSRNNHTSQAPTRNNNSNDNGMGSAFLPILGGAAIGAAGMSMFDHAHSSGNAYDNGTNGDNDNNAYGGSDNFGGGGDYDTSGGDYGGDDFGGGDLGGFDF